MENGEAKEDELKGQGKGGLGLFKSTIVLTEGNILLSALRP